MTAVRVTHLQCDHCEQLTDVGYDSAAEARLHSDWFRQGNSDVCPECAG